MRTLAVALAALFLVAPSTPRKEKVAVKAGWIYTVSGKVIRNGVILIEDGRITEVTSGTRIDSAYRIIDASDQVVVPGLIDAFASIDSTGVDGAATISPDVKAVDGIDVYAKNRSTLAGGVTTIGVYPGGRRLLSGQGAVVKTAGEDRVIRESFGLRVTVGDASKNPPSMYDPPITPSSDNPIKPARRQYPTSRMGTFAELRKLLTEVRDGKRYDREPSRRKPVQAVLDGNQPIVVSADLADDIIKVVRLAKEFDAEIVIANGREASKVADFLKKNKVTVILESAVVPGRPSTFEPTNEQLSGTTDPSSAATLTRAGVPFALHVPADADMRDLLISAGVYIRNGLSEAEALKRITLSAARILGVQDRVGSIEKGKDADLVFLDGKPFGISSTVRRVMVDGEMVFKATEADLQNYRYLPNDSGPRSKDILAIRVGKILTVSQGVIKNGLVIVEDGRIKYVGRDREIPSGARLIEEPDGVLTPGMVDLYSHLGFEMEVGEGARRSGRDLNGAVPSSWFLPTIKLVDLNNDAMKKAATSGVTTIVLAPRTSGNCSVVKLDGPDKARVLREMAAVRLSVGPGRDAYNGLKRQLMGAQKYNKAWEDYERQLKDGKSKPAPPPKKTEAPPTKADPISGRWEGKMTIPEFGQTADFWAELKLNGTKITGKFASKMAGPQEEEIEGTFINNEVTIIREQQGMRAELRMKLVAPDELKGDWQVEVQGRTIKGKMECRRTVKAGGGGATTPSKPATASGPKAPKKNESLEPFRPLFRKEIPAIIAATNVPSIDNALKAFRDDYNLKFVIMGSADSMYASQMLLDKNAAVAFGPDFLIDKRGAKINTAEALASTGIPIAFYSRSQAGTQYVPLVASYAVRYGLDPSDALKAVTLNPARILGLEDRIGSIERGRDGDLVLFSGDPFELTSKVKYVIINGKVVHKK